MNLIKPPNTERLVPRLARHDSNQIKCSIKYLKKECKNVIISGGHRGCLSPLGHWTFRKKRGPEIKRQVISKCCPELRSPNLRIQSKMPILEMN